MLGSDGRDQNNILPKIITLTVYLEDVMYVCFKYCMLFVNLPAPASSPIKKIKQDVTFIKKVLKVYM